ncbi:36685_t:CDS:2, partial [Racocetra persica]
KLEDKEYFIIRNRDNVMTVVLQNVNNKRQMNFIRPDTVVFFGRNTADKESQTSPETPYEDRQGVERNSYNKSHKEPWDESSAEDHICPACENCYDFCDDLRVKRATSVDENGDQICVVPSNLKLKEWSTETQISDLLTNARVPSLLFMVDKQHKDKEGIGPTSFPQRHPKDKTKLIWEELPKTYEEAPHLLNHSSAQFNLQRDQIQYHPI